MPVLVTLEYAPGKKTWIALVTGLGGQFGLEREFIGTTGRVDRQKPGKWDFCLGDGVHELCEMDERSFVLITDDTLKRLKKEDAIALLGGKTTQEAPLTEEELAEMKELTKRKQERDKLNKLRKAESKARQKELDDALEAKLSGLGGDLKITSEGGFEIVEPGMPHAGNCRCSECYDPNAN